MVARPLTLGGPTNYLPRRVPFTPDGRSDATRERCMVSTFDRNTESGVGRSGPERRTVTDPQTPFFYTSIYGFGKRYTYGKCRHSNRFYLDPKPSLRRYQDLTKKHRVHRLSNPRTFTPSYSIHTVVIWLDRSPSCNSGGNPELKKRRFTLLNQNHSRLLVRKSG